MVHVLIPEILFKLIITSYRSLTSSFIRLVQGSDTT